MASDIRNTLISVSTDIHSMATFQAHCHCRCDSDIAASALAVFPAADVAVARLSPPGNRTPPQPAASLLHTHLAAGPLPACHTAYSLTSS